MRTGQSCLGESCKISAKKVKMQSERTQTILPGFQIRTLKKHGKLLRKFTKVDSTSTVTKVVEMTARKNYQMIKQGGFESLTQINKKFRALYKAYTDNGGTTIADEVQAMDFLHVLDYTKYGVLKAQLMNNWTVGAGSPPATVNVMFWLAKVWVKTMTIKAESGVAATYLASVEEQNKCKGKQNKPWPKPGAEETNGQKTPEDLSYILCFHCKEFRHYSIDPNCPAKEKEEEEQDGNLR
jgi:hypothetical protein